MALLSLSLTDSVTYPAELNSLLLLAGGDSAHQRALKPREDMPTAPALALPCTATPVGGPTVREPDTDSTSRAL